MQIELTFNGFYRGTAQSFLRQDTVTFYPEEERVELENGISISLENDWWYPQGARCQTLPAPLNKVAWGEFVAKVCGHNRHKNYRYAELVDETETEWIFTQSVWGYDSDGQAKIRIRKSDWSFYVEVMETASNFTI